MAWSFFCGLLIGGIGPLLVIGVSGPEKLRIQNLVLRREIAILRRRAPKRLRINALDRVLLGWLCHLWPALLDSVVIVRPETVVRWHRAGFRLFWTWKSRRRGGRPPKHRELRELIRRIAHENPLWGAPRIHGELGKLGYHDVCEATVAKYMKRGSPRRGISWKTFVRVHAGEIAAVDMLTVRTLTYECLYAFIVLGLGRRRILHVDVTLHPTAEWLGRQITEAFPWNTAPRFIVRDNDGAYGQVFRWRLSAIGIRDCPTTPHSPWQNGYAERVIGSIRRECLDHIVPLGVDHLRRVMREYTDYYNNDRTHLALGKDSPNSRAAETHGPIVARPILGGLHHRYGRK